MGPLDALDKQTMVTITRRSLLRGAFSMPAIVAANSLMPLRGVALHPIYYCVLGWNQSGNMAMEIIAKPALSSVIRPTVVHEISSIHILRNPEYPPVRRLIFPRLFTLAAPLHPHSPITIG